MADEHDLVGLADRAAPRRAPRPLPSPRALRGRTRARRGSGRLRSRSSSRRGARARRGRPCAGRRACSASPRARCGPTTKSPGLSLSWSLIADADRDRAGRGVDDRGDDGHGARERRAGAGVAPDLDRRARRVTNGRSRCVTCTFTTSDAGSNSSNSAPRASDVNRVCWPFVAWRLATMPVDRGAERRPRDACARRARPRARPSPRTFFASSTVTCAFSIWIASRSACATSWSRLYWKHVERFLRDRALLGLGLGPVERLLGLVERQLLDLGLRPELLEGDLGVLRAGRRTRPARPWRRRGSCVASVGSKIASTSPAATRSPTSALISRISASSIRGFTVTYVIASTVPVMSRLRSSVRRLSGATRTSGTSFGCVASSFLSASPGFMQPEATRRPASSGEDQCGRGSSAVIIPFAGSRGIPRRGNTADLLEISPVTPSAAMKPHPLAEALAVARGVPGPPARGRDQGGRPAAGRLDHGRGPRSGVAATYAPKSYFIFSFDHQPLDRGLGRPEAGPGGDRARRRSASASAGWSSRCGSTARAPTASSRGPTGRPCLECGGEPVCDVDVRAAAAVLRREDGGRRSDRRGRAVDRVGLSPLPDGLPRLPVLRQGRGVPVLRHQQQLPPAAGGRQPVLHA